MSSSEVKLKGRYENGLFVTNSPLATYPLRFRPQTSDPHVFRQIYIDREYACLDDVAEARLIIDCGSNVGFSAAYFLSRFLTCDLIAVEPDAANFQLLLQNLAPYGRRVLALNTAVWSHSCRLTIAQTQYRDGKEWSRQVRECDTGEETGFEAVDIGGLLARSGHQRISILKMDVEGAEAEIFSKNTDSWIDRVDNIAIELHDDSMFGNASSVFAKAIAGRGFTVSRYQELTVCKKRGTY